MKKILHINLKAKYFYEIKNGVKSFEYRLKNDYWNKRLVDKVERVKMFEKIKEDERKKIIHEAQIEFSDKLIEYHTKYLQEQEQLKKDFEYKKIDEININIWDDFYDNGFTPNGEGQNTYAYVEVEDIPDIETKKILEILLDYISKNSLLPESVEVELNFYDSTTKYPILVLENEYCLYKRWQIDFKNITHKILDKLMDDLGKIELSLNEIKFDIYSES